MNSEGLKYQLQSSIAQLENSVLSARDVLAEKFGEDSCVVRRLDEYIKAISCQKDYVQLLIHNSDILQTDEVFRIVRIINGLSIMIKEDAKLIVEEMYSGKTEKLDKNLLN